VADLKFKLALAGEWDSFNPTEGISTAVHSDKKDVPYVVSAACNGFSSLRLLVIGEGDYSIEAIVSAPIELDLFKMWYHKLVEEENDSCRYIADALIPVKTCLQDSLPDKANAVPGQMLQEYWIDFFVPQKVMPNHYLGEVKLTANGQTIIIPFVVDVKDITVPDEPSIIMDNNTYGFKWLETQYQNTFSKVSGKQDSEYWETCIKLLHGYYALANEHRMLFHDLGAGHSGTFMPIYGPTKQGEGRAVVLDNWELFDSHYGPLLDGTLFSKPSPGISRMRRKPQPIWGVYTPINPSWPADYLWWGEPGYEEEFTRGIAAFDSHLQENGWDKSKIEFFFNHKKRYRWFEWDGDEQKFYKDFQYHSEMIRLWESVTLDSSVNWVYRADASWHVKKQFEELGGHRNFWVASSFVFWYPETLKETLNRGETVWTYGSYPSIREKTSSVLENLYATWARGLHGFAHWEVTKPGEDPWFDSNGAKIGTFYPGERFGITGPIPSIRLKVMRNGIQDIDLLEKSLQDSGRKEEVIADLEKAINIELWEKAPAVVSTLPPDDWDNHNMARSHEPSDLDAADIEGEWWMLIRNLAFNRGK
jgi:hypothetical protein